MKNYDNCENRDNRDNCNLTSCPDIGKERDIQFDYFFENWVI